MDAIRPKHVFIFLVLVVVLAHCRNAILKKEKQADLAQQLGIDSNTYPIDSSFPTNYFLDTLKPGNTTIKEVHEMVTGYKLVLHCYRSSEVYYYYSDDDRALRFKIIYDEDKFFSKMLGEDDDSTTLNLEGCVPGLLSE